MISRISHIDFGVTAAQSSAKDLCDGSVITLNNDVGALVGLRWPYALNDQGIYSPTKRRGGTWTGSYWRFPSAADAEAIFTLIRKKFPKLPVIAATGMKSSEAGTRFCAMPVSDTLSMCLLSRQISYFTTVPGLLEAGSLFQEPTVKPLAWPFPARNGTREKVIANEPSREKTDVFHVQLDEKENLLALLAPPKIIRTIANAINAAGATKDPALGALFQTSSNVRVTTANWAVEIQVDLSNPRHWIALRNRHIHVLRGKDGWGSVTSTRRKWPDWKKELDKAELQWEGDDPAADDITFPVSFDKNLVPGWHTPAPNGHLLHAYQKEGAEFCARRGLRALIGDEMGVGKTAQAIATAEATSAERIIVLCPANARYVWDREIRGWSNNGQIQHIERQSETLDMSARWHILTYDVITTRSETWRLNNAQEVTAFTNAFPQLATRKDVAHGNFPRKISLDQPLTSLPTFPTPDRRVAWEKRMRRLKGELLVQILDALPALVILDEAHRVKNRNAKRTKTIQRIAAGGANVVMLTGTPLRNNEHEVAVLLSMLDASASVTLSAKHGYSILDVKDYLGYFMIRRTKAEVLPELPEKTRQRIDISTLDPESMDRYNEALANACHSYFNAIERGKSDAEARQQMQPGIERARVALGVAKVLGGEVVDLVLDVVENKECCVVFCAHHEASDRLKDLLEVHNLRVSIIDGRTSQKVRPTIVSAFQSGQLDVVIGSIEVAGEAITLTRADTVIFVELAWVPAALLQAEDRIHRVGQTSNCQVIQVIARIRNGENLDEMMVGILGQKMAKIGMVLDEDGSNIIAGSIQSEIASRLLAMREKTALIDSPTPPFETPSANAAGQRTQKKASGAPRPAAITQHSGEPASPARTRGRPKKYIGTPPPTATERSKRSVKALAAAGGKRLMLRLTPEALEALKVIMVHSGSTEETATINQVLLVRMHDLLNASTTKKRR